MENLVSFTVLVAVLVNRSGVPEQLLHNKTKHASKTGNRQLF